MLFVFPLGRGGSFSDETKPRVPGGGGTGARFLFAEFSGGGGGGGTFFRGGGDGGGGGGVGGGGGGGGGGGVCFSGIKRGFVFEARAVESAVLDEPWSNELS